MASPLLEIKGLSAGFHTADGLLVAVDDISFSIGHGETVCLVGESGSGKSVTSLSIMRLLDYSGGEILGGEILFEGRNLAKASLDEMRKILGKQIGMIFQEPMSALNPVSTVGGQIAEAVMLHEGKTAEEAWRRAVEMLRLVGLSNPDTRARQYPHEFSGGMRQRVMIAMALACNPKLLIADEPTTALDVTTQAQILALLRRLARELGMSILLITHDMGVAAEMADRIVVMYGGKVVEVGETERIFDQPYHPYTAGLLDCVPRMDGSRGQRLPNLEGRFTPRCPYVVQKFTRTRDPALTDPKGDGHLVATWYNYEPGLATARIEGQPGQAVRPAESGAEPLLEVTEIKKYFPIKGGLLNRTRDYVRAVDGVSFKIYPGETLGLVGESGCGKSTLGRVLLRLQEATGGQVKFEGRDLAALSPRDLRQLRRDVQVIFQDPYASLDPRLNVGEIIGEPLEIHHLLTGRAKEERVAQLMRQVGLDPRWLTRYPHEFSGGQRQRIGIARAIALNPKLIVADEAVSALDVSVQAQIINLLVDLQRELGLTYLFIAHGLSVVRHISTRVGVMYLGRLVELAETDELYENPLHPYTRTLLSAVPVPDPHARRDDLRIDSLEDLDRPRPAWATQGGEGFTLREVSPGHWVAGEYAS